VTVEGIGTVERPYEIGSESAELIGRLAFSNDGTVDFDTTGVGTALSPYTVTANAHLRMADLVDVNDPEGAPANGDVPVWVGSHWEFKPQTGGSGGGTPLPPGGLTDQVLTKLSSADGNAAWGPGVPPGGSTGQVLAKKSATDKDTVWSTPSVNIGERNYATVRRQAAAVSCPNSTQTDMPWDTIDSDNGIPFSAGVFTIPVAGYYDVEAAFNFVANATGYRQIRVLINSATNATSSNNASTATAGTAVGFARTFILAAGDTVMVRVQQNSGAALSTDGNPVSNYVSIVKVPAPAVNGAAASGVWGVAPLDTATYGSNSLVGREVYVDSAGQLRSRPDQDAGWVDIPISAGFAASTDKPQLRRVGSVIYGRGAWSSTGLVVNASNTVGTIPVDLRPAGSVVIAGGSATGSVTTPATVIFPSTGGIQIRTGPTIGSWVYINALTYFLG
jgi:hypothetical protein